MSMTIDRRNPQALNERESYLEDRIKALRRVIAEQEAEIAALKAEVRDLTATNLQAESIIETMNAAVLAGGRP